MSQKAATLSFFMMIPLYLCYQAMVQNQIIPPLLGGYFTAASIMSLPILVYATITSSSCRKMYKLLTLKLALLFFVIYIAVVTFGIVLNVDNAISQYHLVSISRIIALFLLVIVLDADRPWLKKFIFLFIIFYSILILLNSNNGSFVRPAFDVGGKYFELDYQMLAFLYLLLLIYILPSLDHWHRFLIYTLAVPTLYLNGARSEFFGLFLLIFIVETIHLKTIIYWTLGLFCMGAAIIFFLKSDLESLLGYRIFLVFSADQDLSRVARGEFSLNAVATIIESPLLGAYASHPAGAYSHNILSAWVDLGIFGFALLIILLGYSFTTLLFNFQNGRRCAHYTRALSALSITIFLLTAAKTYTYSMVPVAIAFYCIWRQRYHYPHPIKSNIKRISYAY